MIRKVTALLAALSLSCLTYSQTVENIRVDTQGDEIRITYRIGGSTASQFFDVTLSCSMDGGPRFEPATVMGDVGANIVGGKAIYTILWDVFEDVDEVANVEFFVKVDLIRDMDESAPSEPVSSEQQVMEPEQQTPGPEESKAQSQSFERRVFISYNGSLSSPFGLSVGLLKNWGFYGSFRFGGYVDEWQTNIWLTPTAGATKYIIGNERYRLHGFAGLGVSFETYEEKVYYTSWTDFYIAGEAGLTGVIGFLNLTLGVEYLTYYGADLVFGIGFVF